MTVKIKYAITTLAKVEVGSLVKVPYGFGILLRKEEDDAVVGILESQVQATPAMHMQQLALDIICIDYGSTWIIEPLIPNDLILSSENTDNNSRSVPGCMFILGDSLFIRFATGSAPSELVDMATLSSMSSAHVDVNASSVRIATWKLWTSDESRTAGVPIIDKI